MSEGKLANLEEALYTKANSIDKQIAGTHELCLGAAVASLEVSILDIAAGAVHLLRKVTGNLN